MLARIRTTEPPHAPMLWLRYATVIDGMREAIDKRIRAVLPGDKGSIASALITGKRDALSAPVFDAMYISGIGHVCRSPATIWPSWSRSCSSRSVPRWR